MSSDSDDQVPPARPGIAVTLMILIGIVPFMAGMLGLFALFGVGLPYFGFLFLLYWAGMMRQAPAEFLPSLLGGLAGIGLAWLLIALPARTGVAGQVVGFAAMASVLFCFLRGQVRMVVNNALMLFLTVAVIGELKIAENAWMMVASTLIGAGYMGGVTWVMTMLAKRKRSDAEAVPASI